MQEINYTSLELSKKLVDNGCNLESEYYHQLFYTNEKKFVFNKPPKSNKYNSYQAYDILNDICVKYAKEFFGEEWDEEVFDWVKEEKRYEVITKTILLILQEGQEGMDVNEFIWENCLFNPKNK